MTRTLEPQVQIIKDPLPPHVLQALATLHTYIVCCQINYTSRREEARRQAYASLKIVTDALDMLSFEEYMELREKAEKAEKAAKHARKQEPTPLVRQKRSA